MSDIQIKKQPRKYDVVIVGSGAGGGMAAYVLANAGLKVCLLEAGYQYDPQKNVTQLKNPWDSPRRGASTSIRPFGDFDACYGGWSLDGEPYKKEAGTEWMWWRARMLGGRTNHWGRISLRFGPKDFKRRSIDGLGDDWPIGYEDIKPYYDAVDKLIGVFGTNECNRNCSAAKADFSSTNVLIYPALKTGTIDMVCNAMAREVLTNSEGLATGVSYVSTTDMQEYQVEGRVVILAASACESARLLLNSKSQRHPNGLANSSDVVGKYLHDSTGAALGGILPQLFDRKRYNEDGVGGMHIYSPWWLDNKKLDFPRGYHIEYWGGMSQPSYGFNWGIEGLNGKYLVHGKKKEAGGYGASLKEDHRYFYGCGVGMAGRGEAIPLESNYCAIDNTAVDKYGIPVLKFNVKWSEHEIRQAKHMKETFKEVMHNMGAVITWGGDDDESNQWGLSKPGEIIHEAGTVRMGNDPKRSALNSWNQAHDCKNLFCVDGGAFVSQADKNITWTILALSMRTSEYIINQLKQQQL